jgi:hypothetical protein
MDSFRAMFLWIPNQCSSDSPLVLKIETIYVPILAVQYRQKYLQKQTCQVLYTNEAI